MADTGKAGADPGFAPAKINLALHVTGQRGDGLHLLDSLVAFADVGDHLTAQTADKASVTVTGPRARGVPTDDSNLVLKAAAWIGGTARFTLSKHLPAAAGIGGGSSDAAAALRLLAAQSGQPIPPGAEALGADIPVCLVGRAARMRGIGEVLEPVKLPPLPTLLVNPGVAVPTGQVFANLASKINPPMPDRIPRFAEARDAAIWLTEQRNDLQYPAITLAPVIGETLGQMSGLPGALLARMSGSGATCFALFANPDQAERAEAILRAKHPDWWSVATTLT